MTNWLTPAGLHTAAARLPVEGQLPSFGGATRWYNSPPLTPADLRGKVVLVDFWTYTCINWLRTLPYIRAWAEKYADHGLVVIGVHTPEFPFEKDAENVHWALKDMRVDYPVATDNDYAVWEALDNHYWPALYFADAQGHIRHHYFGEGEYQQSEMVIQQLMAEAGSTGFSREMVSVDPRGLEVAADWDTVRSAENYTGYERSEGSPLPAVRYLASGTPIPLPNGCASISGPCRATGRCTDRAPRPTRPAGASHTAFTPAISISSWDRRREEPPCRSRHSSTGNRRALPTEMTLTSKAMAR